MAVDGFARALPRVLAYEGGKVDDPRDPGGRTNQGVTQVVYTAWRTRKKQPARDVYLMTDSERDAIYRAQYWDAVQGDKLPAGVDFVVFDGAVNSGPKQSIKWLQRALGVEADGVLGTVTLAAVEGVIDHDALVGDIVDRREAFLRALKTFKTYSRGWLSRTANVRKLGMLWATGMDDVVVRTAEVAPTKAKALVDDAKVAGGGGMADGTSGVGAGTVVLGGVLKTTQETLEPYAVSGGWIEKLVVILVVAGAVITIAGLAYRLWLNHHKATMADVLDLPRVASP